MAFVVVATITLRVLRHLFGQGVTTSDAVEATPTTSTGDLALQVYHLMQAAAYVVMATLIMRLKLFLSPQLAVLSGLLPALLRDWGLSVSGSLHHHRVSLSLSLSLSTEVKVQVGAGGTAGLQFSEGLAQLPSPARESRVVNSDPCHVGVPQQSVIGEYNNPEGEKLALWIRDHTPQTAVFAGTMPTMAAVLLTTGRPVVNHPHYEAASLRSGGGAMLIKLLHVQEPDISRVHHLQP